MLLSKDLREFVECLNSNRVEYLVVGALAVSWHGYPRYSADVDFLVRPSLANAERLLSAIHQFGFGGLDFSMDDPTATGKVIQFGNEPNRSSHGRLPCMFCWSLTLRLKRRTKKERTTLCQSSQETWRQRRMFRSGLRTGYYLSNPIDIFIVDAWQSNSLRLKKASCLFRL